MTGRFPSMSMRSASTPPARRGRGKRPVIYKAEVVRAAGKEPKDNPRKRMLGIMAAILASLHMQTADDLFGGPQGSPRTDKLIDASIQWAERIMRRIDSLGP